MVQGRDFSSPDGANAGPGLSFPHTRNMKKIIHILAIASVALVGAGLSSCGCCTGEAEAPPLQPLPQFKEIPQVHYGK